MKMMGPSASSCVPKNESVHNTASSLTSLSSTARSLNSERLREAASGEEEAASERKLEKSSGFGSCNGSAITGGG